MPDRSVDAIITDPPYGKRAARGTNGFGSASNRRYQGSWDDGIPCKEVFDNLLRVTSGPCIIFGGNYFAHLLPPSKCWLVWDKKGDIKFKNPFADCELLWTNLSKPIRKYTFKQQGFITDSKDERLHPTQKPTELLAQIIKDFCPSPTITILDPFCGSGSTGVAARSLGHRFIGIEREAEYCKIARNRLLPFGATV